MTYLEEKYLMPAIRSMAENFICDISESMGFQKEGNGEIIKNLLFNSDSPFRECKVTIAGRKDKTLDLIISKPGLEDTKYSKVNGLDYSGIQTDVKNKINYKSNRFEIDFELNPKNKEYMFLIYIYPDKEVYKAAEKLFNLKNR